MIIQDGRDRKSSLIQSIGNHKKNNMFVHVGAK